MVFPVVGGTQDTGAYQISNSLRFEDGDSPDLRFDGQMAAGNRRTFTYSFWTKRGNLGINTCVFSVEASDVVFRFGTSDDIQFKDVNNDSFNLSTNNVFRDVSAWYHIVVAVDTTDGTAANRIKLYVNGTQQTTGFGTASYPSQNHDTEQNNNGDSMYIGARTDSTTEGSSMTQHYDGYIADFHLIDGAQKAASDFGEFNDNGVWIPKKYAGTYGTNGFKLEFQQTGTSANASGKGADTSGQGNHFDDTNITAAEITTDTPTNNFATLNSLNIRLGKGLTHGYGNLQAQTGTSSGTLMGASTIAGLKSGKWYAEYKATVVGTNATMRFGIESSDFHAADGLCNVAASAWASNGNKGRNATDTSHGDSYDDNDIIGVAVDLDNGAIYFSKNGTWQNSSDPESGASKTGAAYTDILTILPDGGYMFAFNFSYNNSQQETVQANFGNPIFSISSGNSDGNGYGNFEYAVPSGYYSLCTKNLAEYG